MVDRSIDTHCYVCGSVRLYEGGEQGLTIHHDQYRKEFPDRYPTGEVCGAECVEKLLSNYLTNPADIEEGKKRHLQRLKLNAAGRNL